MSEKRPFLLAIDAGTSSLKAVVYSRNGQNLSSAAVRYGYQTPQPGWAEAQPGAWWEALVEALGQIRQETGGLDGLEVLALTGQMHTGVLLDEHFEPLEPTILWLDRRAAEETAELQSVFALPPYHLNSTYTLPKLLWLARRHPQLVQRACCLLWPKDYLRYKLTGQALTDYTEPGGAGLLDWDKLDWARERLTYTGFDPAILPPLRHATDDAGELLPDIAARFGLPKDVRVLTGTGDVLALITGAPPAEGRITCSLGSSSMVFYPMPRGQMFGDPHGRIYTYPLLPLRMLGGVTSTSGAAIQWAWQSFFGEELSYGEAVAGALQVPPGAGGSFFLPFLSGERSPFWNDNLRGGFYGLTLAHTRYHLLRAVMEGVGYSLRTLLDIYGEVGVQVKEIALAGGGTETPGMAQIIADTCHLPVLIFAGQDTVTHGLYAYACQVQDGEPFEQALARTFNEPVCINPNPENRLIYDNIYGRYALLTEFVHHTLGKQADLQPVAG